MSWRNLVASCGWARASRNGCCFGFPLKDTPAGAQNARRREGRGDGKGMNGTPSGRKQGTTSLIREGRLWQLCLRDKRACGNFAIGPEYGAELRGRRRRRRRKKKGRQVETISLGGKARRKAGKVAEHGHVGCVHMLNFPLADDLEAGWRRKEEEVENGQAGKECGVFIKTW
jgi:hypothetical protein